MSLKRKMAREQARAAMKRVAEEDGNSQVVAALFMRLGQKDMELLSAGQQIRAVMKLLQESQDRENTMEALLMEAWDEIVHGGAKTVNDSWLQRVHKVVYEDPNNSEEKLEEKEETKENAVVELSDDTEGAEGQAVEGQRDSVADPEKEHQ